MDKLVGSTVSLQGLMQAAGGEAIPKEFHRKVLKKIAQLTKVIYALNTKNDEHEEFVQRLRSLHEAEVQRLLKDSTTRLQGWQEGWGREREAAEGREGRLREKLAEVQGERDQLRETQVSYRKEVEQKLAELRTEHTQQVQQLTKHLERLRSEQGAQLKEVAELREGFARRAKEQMEALRVKHKKEVGEINERSGREMQKMETELGLLKDRHEKELSELKSHHNRELEAQKVSLSGVQGELLAKELKKWEEKQEALSKEFAEREETLKQQISTLSNDLRVARDQLALSEQRLRELESQFEETQTDSSVLRERLKGTREEAQGLRRETESLRNELELAREQYRQQSAELQSTSATVGRLEAVRVSQEGELVELRAEVSALKEDLSRLHGDLHSQQKSNSEREKEKIRALEKELERVSREKRELHAQYAREIEAAHAQLSQKEVELGAGHRRALQEQQDEQMRALQEAGLEREAALETLRAELEAVAREELLSLKEAHSSAMARLQEELTGKASDLEAALRDLERLRAAMTEKEEGLGSATGHIESLRAELGRVQRELGSIQQQWEGAGWENGELKLLASTDKGPFSPLSLQSSLESLHSQHGAALRAHREELQRTRTSLTQELEQKWLQRVKDECARLRLELSERHRQDSRAGLAELASLKDAAMREAREEWERERRRLEGKIEDLEHWLQELRHSTEASLESAKSTAEELIANLRRELKEERARHTETIEKVRHTHSQQLQTQLLEFENKKKELSEELASRHETELHAVQEANQLAVGVLRSQLEQQGREDLVRAATEHREEMAALRAELASQCEGEVFQVREELRAEVERHHHQLQSVAAQRQREVTEYQSSLESVRGEVGQRDSELHRLRDRINSLTVATNDLRKELEVKGHEVLSIRRETNTQIRLREQQLSAAHHAEVEALSSQHRHQSHLLLADFNQAKRLLTNKISELQKQLAELEHRYRSRESRPEDLEAIKELKLTVQEQERKMKELITEKRIYQLELMNREKNYNKLFSANPQVGVLDPLQFKKKRVGEGSAQRHASAPSLVSPNLEQSSQLVQVEARIKKAALAELEAVQHISEPRPRKLIALKDSPLTQQKFGKSMSVGNHSASLKPAPSVSPPKQTMVVQ